MSLSVKSSAGQAQWRPFREFENLYAEMDRLAQSVFGGLTGEGAWLPAADIVETDSAYVIEVELPGVRREDVDVNLKRQRIGGNRRGEGTQARGFVPPSDPAGR